MEDDTSEDTCSLSVSMSTAMRGMGVPRIDSVRRFESGDSQND